jgi:hypothetical protein
MENILIPVELSHDIIIAAQLGSSFWMLFIKNLMVHFLTIWYVA